MRLGQAEAAEHVAARERLQVLLLLRVGAERVDRPADDRVLHADDRRRRAVAGGDLLERHGERHVVHAGAVPLLRHDHAERAELAERAQLLAREVCSRSQRAALRRELAPARTRASCRGPASARRSAAWSARRRAQARRRRRRGPVDDATRRRPRARRRRASRARAARPAAARRARSPHTGTRLMKTAARAGPMRAHAVVEPDERDRGAEHAHEHERRPRPPRRAAAARDRR